jgi:PST family polysaccharide transporter
VTRDGRFAPEAIAVIMSQIAWSVAVVALSLHWGDHRAMAAGLVVYVVTYVLATNFVLPMRFGLAWDREVARDAARYGAPLVPNGIALAVTSLSDRLIVGGLRGLDALALYGPLVATAMLPRATVLRYLYNMVLPSMVRLQQETGAFPAQMAGWLSAVSLVAATMGLGFICLADPVIALVFGARYAPGPELASLMGLLLACRLVVAFPVPAAMARGRTWFVTGSSLIAAVALAPAALALGSAPGAVRSGLAAFLATLIIVETIGIALILVRARRAFPDVTAGMLRSAALVGVLVAGAAAACHLMGAEAWTQRLLPCGVAALFAGLAFGRDLLAFLRGQRSP